MSILTAALYNLLASDTTLTDMLSTYGAEPAIFTTDPAPGNAELPYIVTAGEVSQVPFDTKNSLGRDLLRDIRCYTAETGSVELIEAIVERVRYLLHRQELSISGWLWMISDVTGPLVADEADTYGRILTLRLIETEIPNYAPGFLLRDEFLTTEAAPLASPRACEPGPGFLNVFDLANKLNISGGRLLFDGNANFDPEIMSQYSYNVNDVGLAVSCEMLSISTTARARFGWIYPRIRSTQIGRTLIYGDSVTNQLIWVCIAPGTIQSFVMIMTSFGWLSIIAENNIYYLMFVEHDSLGGSGANLFAGITNATGIIEHQYDNLKIFQMGAPWNDSYGIITDELLGIRSIGDTYNHEADFILEFIINILPSAGNIEISFRRLDVNNYWFVVINSAGSLYLYEYIGGVPIQRGIAVGVVSSGERIAVTAIGQSLTIYESQKNRISYYNAVNFQTETTGEIFSLGTGGIVSDLIIWPRIISGDALSELERYMNV